MKQQVCGKVKENIDIYALLRRTPHEGN